MAGHVDSDIFQSGVVENVGVTAGSDSKSISVQTLFYFQVWWPPFWVPYMSDDLGVVWVWRSRICGGSCWNIICSFNTSRGNLYLRRLHSISGFPAAILDFWKVINLHCGAEKRHPFCFCNNSSKYRQIFMIFGTQHPEEIWQQVVRNLPTSPISCGRTTLWHVKMSFLNNIQH